MVDAARHPKVEILAYSEVEKVEGYVGNFRVTVRGKPRYVNAERCNGCGECARVCPIEVPNEFDEGIAPRKAIYVPLQQAVPLVYTVDKDACIECYKCVDACGKLEAIDFSQRETVRELEVGAIVAATGFDPYDPSPIAEYGYGVFPNVLTAMEWERLSNDNGPTIGKVRRPSDGKAPERVAFVQCVGSRDARFHLYCSGFCCMYTIKNALLYKEKHPETDVTIFYMDIRTPQKGYEEFYRRARALGVNFIQGRPAEIVEDPRTRDLTIFAEDTGLGRQVRVPADVVVLSTAAVPRFNSLQIGQALTIASDQSGFFQEYHPKLRPVDSPTDGVFLAGSAQGPKDIPYSVAQGSAAAARAGRILAAGQCEIEPIVAYVDQARCRNTRFKCAVCAQRCPYQAIVAPPGQAAYVIAAKCHGCGTCVADCPADCIDQYHFTDAQIKAQIDAITRERAEEKIVTFMCHWCSYGGADMAGTSHLEYPPSSRGIRVMCSGRIDRDFVLYAFQKGAGMVLVSGCHKQDCHYITGQQYAEKRLKGLLNLLNGAGISPERFRVEWISAAEGEKYAQVITKMNANLRELGPEVIRQQNQAAQPNLNRALGKTSGRAHVPAAAVAQP